MDFFQRLEIPMEFNFTSKEELQKQLHFLQQYSYHIYVNISALRHAYF